MRESASESGWGHLRILEKRVKYMRERARESACESVLKTAPESARQSAPESKWEGVWKSASESGWPGECVRMYERSA